MKIKRIYKETIGLWPKRIDISDGYHIKATNGFRSQNLSIAWETAEKFASNEWQNLMVWIIYQILHKKAIEIFNSGGKELMIESIDLKEIESKYLNALSVDEYEDMLKRSSL